MDDGSTDRTPSILQAYKPRAVLFRQPNAGLGAARDALCRRVQGDIVAALDSDDLWHPRYLEVQRQLIQEYPDAVAYFTGHVNFEGSRDYEWTSDPLKFTAATRVIPSAAFVREYNAAPGPFASMSYCCVPADVLRRLGDAPFRLRKSEDLYFFSRVALLGPIVHAGIPLVAYRIRPGSLSSNRLLLAESTVRTFELLEGEYGAIHDKDLAKGFYHARANKRRMYAKTLMGAGRTLEARSQVTRSLRDCANIASVAKSMALLLFTYMPTELQPAWPQGGCDSRIGSTR
jgi:glycosyltransferase involved in cell wall biosynthesis